MTIEYSCIYGKQLEEILKYMKRIKDENKYSEVCKRLGKYYNACKNKKFIGIDDMPLVNLFIDDSLKIADKNKIEERIAKLEEIAKNNQKWLRDILNPNTARENSIGRLREFSTIVYILSNKNIHLSYQPQHINGKSRMPDLCIKLNSSKEIYLEITSLIPGRGIIEEILYDLCKKIALCVTNKLIERKINSRTWIALSIDNELESLLKCNKHESNIDDILCKFVSDFKKMFNKELDSQNFDNKNNYLIEGHIDQSYLKSAHLRNQSPLTVRKIKKDLKANSVKVWISCLINIEDERNTNIILEKEEKKIVEKLREKLIPSKNSETQLVPNKPNILVIQVWDPFITDSYLRKRIKQWICDHKSEIENFESLAGIWIHGIGKPMQDNLRKGSLQIDHMYIPVNNLLSKDELESIGITI